MPFTRLAVSPAALLAAALIAPLAVAGPKTDVCEKSVPFKAEVTTVEMVSPNPGPARCPAFPFVVGSTTGSGQASHLGAVALTASDCIQPPGTFMPENVPAVSNCYAPQQPPLGAYWFHDGIFELVAANGDKVTANYSGLLVPTGAGSPIYRLCGSYTLTSGTGRFKNACGSGVLEGTENLGTGQGQFKATGVISY